MSGNAPTRTDMLRGVRISCTLTLRSEPDRFVSTLNQGAPMGARTGQEYIDRLASTRPTVEVNGERISGPVTEHPALAGVLATYAGLYDFQHDPDYRDALTYESPTSGERVGSSFLVPRNAEDLEHRRAGYQAWARHSLGFLGRTGDYLNSALMALSEAGPWFEQADPRFGDNARKYYEMVREQDLLTTHTLIPPQATRAVGPGQEIDGRALGAHVVDQDDNGIVVRGARMLATIGPTSDELLVFPSTVLRGTPEDEPYSFAFAINCDAPACGSSAARASTTGGSIRWAAVSTRSMPWSSSTTFASRGSACSCSATPSCAMPSTP